ncbi:MAG: VanW family protein [Romboutsia sp.]
MKRLKIIILLSVGIFFLGSINLAQAISKDGKIHKNISIMSVDVSKLSKLEAKTKLEKIINKYNKMSLVNKDEVYKINMKDILVIYNIDEAVEKAYNIGRDKDIISNIKTNINLYLGECKNIKLTYTYNENLLNKYINNLKESIYKEPIDATIKLENNKLEYKKEVNGSKLNTENIKRIIISKIDKIFINQDEIKIIDIKPKYTYSELSKIDTILGTYETYFNTKLNNRVNNINVAAEATNNIIVNPLEEFSFNYYVNKNNIQSKFEKAPVIINGKLKPGLGGGICQVSSTMYNAALYAGLEITNVKNHSIPSSYVSKGRDATVATGDLDFKFKNQYNSPILITHKIDNNKIVTTIYGNKEDKKDIEVITEIIKSIPNKIKIRNSEELYEGEKTIYQKGRVGYKVNTIRIDRTNESKKTELISQSYYPPKDKIVEYGTKKKN